MRLLLGTHAFLWLVTDDHQLSVKARSVIADEDNEVLVSAASAWEIATKHRLGKLGGAAGAVDGFAELIAADGFTHLAVTYVHALRAGGYNQGHRDPFDRLLAAHSELEALTLVTLDPAFADFGTRTLW